MMKQFERTMLTVVGLAVAAAVLLSSIPARAAGPSRSVTANGLGTSVTIFDSLSIPNDSVMANAQISRVSNTTYFLNYFINDTAGIVNDSSFGSIPASSVNVSGGTVESGKTVITLNVNTCDFPEFMANGQGPCGAFDLTWTELPASVAGWSSSRENVVIVFANGEKVTATGDVVGFSALVTGTALSYSNTGSSAFGALTKERNVTKTFTTP